MFGILVWKVEVIFFVSWRREHKHWFAFIHRSVVKAKPMKVRKVGFVVVVTAKGMVFS